MPLGATCSMYVSLPEVVYIGRVKSGMYMYPTHGCSRFVHVVLHTPVGQPIRLCTKDTKHGCEQKCCLLSVYVSAATHLLLCHLLVYMYIWEGLCNTPNYTFST